MYLIGKEYSLRTYVENLSALIEELDLRDITFVVQGWGGSIAVDETWLHAYSAPFKSKEECKGAIEFPLDFRQNTVPYPRYFSYVSLIQNISVPEESRAVIIIVSAISSLLMPRAMAFFIRDSEQ